MCKLIELADDYIKRIQDELEDYDRETERIFTAFDRAARAALVKQIPELDGLDIEVSYQTGYRIILDGHYPVMVWARIPCNMDECGRPTFDTYRPIVITGATVDWPGMIFDRLGANHIENGDVKLTIGLAIRYAKLPDGVRIVECARAADAFPVSASIPDSLVIPS